MLTVTGNLNNSGSARASGNNGAAIVVQGTLTNAGQLSTGIGPNNTNTVSAGVALNQTAAGTLYGSGIYSAPSLSLNGSLRRGDFSSGDQRVGTLRLDG